MIAPIGTYRDRITILKRSTSNDTQGGRAITWIDLVTASATILTRFSASVLPSGMSERLQATAAMGADQEYRVEMRYRADVTPLMRVLWTPFNGTAKTLEIRGVQPKDGQRDAIQLLCSEVI